MFRLDHQFAREVQKRYKDAVGPPPSQKIMQDDEYDDYGDDDYLFRGNDALHTLMRKRNIPSEFRMRDGAHTWEYWRTGLGDALKFIGIGFIDFFSKQNQ